MSGPWDKYVEPAAEALGKATAWIAPTTHPWEGMSEQAKDRNRMHVEAVLDVIGPLIAEDTRDRMVAAAAAALEREKSPFYYCPTSGEIEQTYDAGFQICCDAPGRHEPITAAAVKAAQKVPPL